jgi:uncharacterized membrane protein YhhN
MIADRLTFGRWRALGTADRALVVLSLLGGAGYLVTAGVEPGVARAMIKALGVAPLALLAARVLRGPDRGLLAAALALSSIGDVLLALPGGHFVQGLLAFLAAHVVYIALFVRHWQRPERPRRGRLVLAAAVIVYDIAIFRRLSPGFGELAGPVTAYGAALTLMAVTAILTGVTRLIVPAGAVLFVLSDSMIAMGQFGAAVPFGGVLTWATYYVGQYCIAMGFIAETAGATASRIPPRESGGRT